MKLSIPQQWAVAASLAALMVLTRGQHFASLAVLPNASWAVFFLAGVYLQPRLAFAGFILLAASLDLAAVSWGGVSNFCTSLAYPFLLPAYAALWLAGRWYSVRHSAAASTLAPLAGSLLIGAALCELWSSGGFYFFSGRFAEPGLAEFASRLALYFPAGLEALAFWCALAALLHLALALTARPARAAVDRHDG